MTRKQEAPQNESVTIARLQQQVALLSNQLNQLLGIPQVRDDGTTVQHDHIAFGSEEHAAMLGISEVNDPATLLEDEPTYTSPNTGKMYKLEDSITPFLHTANPPLFAQLTLREKVNSLEGGAPKVPENAPPLMTFNDPDLRRAIQVGATVTQ